VQASAGVQQPAVAEVPFDLGLVGDGDRISCSVKIAPLNVITGEYGVGRRQEHLPALDAGSQRKLNVSERVVDAPLVKERI
jgi:hypothetical protein